MKYYLLGALLLLGACTNTPPSSNHICRVPVWSNGIAICASRLADKNSYWIARINSGTATQEQTKRILESNQRAWEALIKFLEANKELAAGEAEAAQAEQE